MAHRTNRNSTFRTVSGRTVRTKNLKRRAGQRTVKTRQNKMGLLKRLRGGAKRAMTSARRAALEKAQQASAAARKGKGKAKDLRTRAKNTSVRGKLLQNKKVQKARSFLNRFRKKRTPQMKKKGAS